MKSRFKTLTPFLDESDVLRVGGRIDRAAVCYDVKHLIIIPQDHQLCRLVILDCHKKLNHEGTQHVRNDLRFRLLYCIPHSRSTVRKVLNDCSLCKRRRSVASSCTLFRGWCGLFWANYGQALAQAVMRKTLWMSLYLLSYQSCPP